MNRELARRLLFGLALLVAWIGQLLVLGRVRGTPYASGLVKALHLSVVLSKPGLIVLSLVFVGGVALFLKGGGNRWGTRGGLAAFAVAWLAALLEASQWPSGFGVHHNKLMPLSALGAHVLTTWLARRAPQPERDAKGWEAAAGVVGAIYFIAGCSKLVGSGLSWFWPGNLGLLIGERLDTTITPFAWARGLVAHSPLACSSLAFAAVAVELAGPVFLMPRWRRVFALAAAATHFGIFVLLGYFYPAWVLTLAALVVRKPAADRERG